VTGLGIDASPYLLPGELSSAMAAADLVIAHAGVGSALAAMQAGHCPVLIPRRRARGEHVDDHQLQLAAELAARGLASVAEPEELDRPLLAAAAARRVRMHRAPPPFLLESA
jgi:UDP-N-acetylglucosamine transferase subunit ALG13